MKNAENKRIFWQIIAEKESEKGLTNEDTCVTISQHSASAYRGIEQLEARRAHNPEVGGSSPPPATKKAHRFRCRGRKPGN